MVVSGPRDGVGEESPIPDVDPDDVSATVISILDLKENPDVRQRS